MDIVRENEQPFVASLFCRNGRKRPLLRVRSKGSNVWRSALTKDQIVCGLSAWLPASNCRLTVLIVGYGLVFGAAVENIGSFVTSDFFSSSWLYLENRRLNWTVVECQASEHLLCGFSPVSHCRLPFILQSATLWIIETFVLFEFYFKGSRLSVVSYKYSSIDLKVINRHCFEVKESWSGSGYIMLLSSWCPHSVRVVLFFLFLLYRIFCILMNKITC